MTLEVIQDFDRLASIGRQWSKLICNLPIATPFQRSEWLLTWWRHFGSGELRVFSFWESGLLVGLIPCFLHDWAGRKQLTLVGSGITDYLEPLLIPEVASEAVDLLRDHLDSEQDWDVCDWQDLAQGSPLMAIASEVRQDTPCQVVPLREPFSEFWSTRSSNLRRNVRRYRDRAEAEAVIRFEVAGATDPALLNELIQLHGARWREHGESGMIVANHSAEFLRDVARKFDKLDMTRIFCLRFDNRTAALIFALESRKRMYNYLSGYDPELERFGVGRMLLFEELRYLSECGYAAMDFLRGDETYKSWWGAEKMPKARVIIHRIRQGSQRTFAQR